MSLLIATDLDQTLIYSPGAASRGPQRDARVVELLDGLVISLLSSRTERDLRELQRHAVLVPATTRTRAQYERIDHRPGRTTPSWPAAVGFWWTANPTSRGPRRCWPG